MGLRARSYRCGINERGCCCNRQGAVIVWDKYYYYSYNYSNPRTGYERKPSGGEIWIREQEGDEKGEEQLARQCIVPNHTEFNSVGSWNLPVKGIRTLSSSLHEKSLGDFDLLGYMKMYVPCTYIVLHGRLNRGATSFNISFFLSFHPLLNRGEFRDPALTSRLKVTVSFLSAGGWIGTSGGERGVSSRRGVQKKSACGHVQAVREERSSDRDMSVIYNFFCLQFKFPSE